MSKAAQRAKELINQHNLTIPINVTALVKELGIELVVKPLESMSGFAYQKDGHRVIGINKNDGPKRRRFTTAHELGHMLIHTDIDVSFDKKNELVYFRDSKSSSGSQPREIEANAFAAELLMPSDSLLDSISKLGGVDLIEDDKKIRDLAKEYNVSFMAMSVRVDAINKQHML